MSKFFSTKKPFVATRTKKSTGNTNCLGMSRHGQYGTFIVVAVYKNSADSKLPGFALDFTKACDNEHFQRDLATMKMQFRLKNATSIRINMESNKLVKILSTKRDSNGNLQEFPQKCEVFACEEPAVDSQEAHLAQLEQLHQLLMKYIKIEENDRLNKTKGTKQVWANDYLPWNSDNDLTQTTPEMFSNEDHLFPPLNTRISDNGCIQVVNAYFGTAPEEGQEDQPPLINNLCLYELGPVVQSLFQLNNGSYPKDPVRELGFPVTNQTDPWTITTRLEHLSTALKDGAHSFVDPDNIGNPEDPTINQDWVKRFLDNFSYFVKHGSFSEKNIIVINDIVTMVVTHQGHIIQTNEGDDVFNDLVGYVTERLEPSDATTNTKSLKDTMEAMNKGLTNKKQKTGGENQGIGQRTVTTTPTKRNTRYGAKTTGLPEEN